MTMNAKQRFLARYEVESSKTAKVLKAFPGGECEFKPHDRSNSAKSLAWTFVIEEQLLLKSLNGEQVLGGGFPPAPDSWDTVIDTYTKGSAAVLAALKDPKDGDLP